MYFFLYFSEYFIVLSPTRAGGLGRFANPWRIKVIQDGGKETEIILSKFS